jgi:hypothetical protein
MGAKTKPPRLVMAIDVPDREGEGERLLQLYASGLVKLPQSLRNQIALVEQKGRFQDVGADFGPQLERYGPWRAHRGSSNALPIRDAAALMGHNVATHLKHYGSWTDEASLEAAVEGFNAGVHPVGS